MRTRKTHIPDPLRNAVFERDHHTCAWCGNTEHLHADHIVPESKGGTTTLENLQTLCQRCNLARGRNGLTKEQIFHAWEQQQIVRAHWQEQVQKARERGGVVLSIVEIREAQKQGISLTELIKQED